MKTKLFTLTLLLMSAGAMAQNTATDVSAIKTVIEQESAAFRQGKADKVLSYWLNAPYVSHDYTEKGSGYLRGYGAVSKAIRKYIGDHPEMATDKTVYKSHDYQIRVNGNSAWATFVTDAVNSTKKPIEPPMRSYDARYLEKANGGWKLVAVTGKSVPLSTLSMTKAE